MNWFKKTEKNTENATVAMVEKTAQTVQENTTPATSIVEMIHKEFDDAEDVLLQQADALFNELDLKLASNPIINAKKKAERLEKLGFNNSSFVKTVKEKIEETMEQQRILVSSKEQAALIREYKQEYPLLKFLTEKELIRICNKYSLIYAPVTHYTGDVPEKNLLEIEQAKELNKKHIHETLFEMYNMSIYSENTDLINFLKDKPSIKFTEGDVGSYYGMNERAFEEVIRFAGFKGKQQDKYWYREVKVKSDTKQGLFIAAPKAEFDLTGLTKIDELSYASVTTQTFHDPIVFRWCKGGLQVLTKWGLEASDEKLVNEIFN